MTSLSERAAALALAARFSLRHPVWWFRARRDRSRAKQLERAGWPDALAKAVADNPWSYALALRDGSLIHFTGATPGVTLAWVTLLKPTFRHGDRLHLEARRGASLDDTPIIFERGAEIRVADIVWIIDAPWGS